MTEEMRGEAMDAVVTAVEKYSDNMEVGAVLWGRLRASNTVARSLTGIRGRTLTGSGEVYKRPYGQEIRSAVACSLWRGIRLQCDVSCTNNSDPHHCLLLPCLAYRYEQKNVLYMFFGGTGRLVAVLVFKSCEA